MSVRITASRLSALERFRPADDPAIHDARRDHAAAKIEAAIVKIAADAPPLTDEQAAHLSVLLSRSGRR